MPEFQLELGSDKAAKRYKALDPFTRGYIEAMFFTDTGSGDDEGLENVAVCNLSNEAWGSITKDCAVFQKLNAELLERAYSEADYDSEKAGRDFWYTRNGHGVGFWDRGLGEIGVALSETCGWKTKFGELDLYLGDDGQIYLS